MPPAAPVTIATLPSRLMTCTGPPLRRAILRLFGLFETGAHALQRPAVAPHPAGVVGAMRPPGLDRFGRGGARAHHALREDRRESEGQIALGVATGDARQARQRLAREARLERRALEARDDLGSAGRGHVPRARIGV